MAKELKDGDKVFLDVDTLKADGTDRPYAYMGYSITEHPDGTRESKSFTFPNESREVQERWGEEPRESPSEQDYIDTINEMNYTDFPEIDLEDGISKVDDDIGFSDENNVDLNIDLDSDANPDSDIEEDQDTNIDYDVGVDADDDVDFDAGPNSDSNADF